MLEAGGWLGPFVGLIASRVYELKNESYMAFYIFCIYTKWAYAIGGTIMTRNDYRRQLLLVF